jgi:hypothetical protein
MFCKWYFVVIVRSWFEIIKHDGWKVWERVITDMNFWADLLAGDELLVVVFHKRPSQ